MTWNFAAPSGLKNMLHWIHDRQKLLFSKKSGTSRFKLGSLILATMPYTVPKIIRISAKKLSLSHLEQVQPYSTVYVRVLLTYIWPSRNQTCLYLCICSNRDRLGLYAEFSIILGQCTFLWPTAEDVNLNYSPNWRWIVVMSSPSVVIMHSIDLIKIVRYCKLE